MTSSKLIAPGLYAMLSVCYHSLTFTPSVIDISLASAYDWCIDAVKNSPYAGLASELEITKALSYLKLKDFGKAIECLKLFERKDAKMASAAATNLSFLYYLVRLCSGR